MADLGNLYFDILFRDKTAEQRKKLKAEILSLIHIYRFYGIDCFLAVKFANKYVSYMPSFPQPHDKDVYKRQK